MEKKEIKEIIESALLDYNKYSGIIYHDEIISSSGSEFGIEGEFTSQETRISLVKEHTVLKLFSKNTKTTPYIFVKVVRKFTFVGNTSQCKSFKCYDKNLYLKVQEAFDSEDIKKAKEEKLREYNHF